MKVRFVAPSPKAGTIEHLEPHRAQPLIDAGFAELIPPAKRGTNEWLKDMADQEALRVATIPQCEREILHVDRWEVSQSTRRDDGNITIVLTQGATKFYFVKGAHISDKDFKRQMDIAGCPANIVDHYLRVLSEKVDPEILAERRVQQFNRDYAAAKAQNARENGAAYALVGKAASISQERPR
jgi:hypothetical protein